MPTYEYLCQRCLNTQEIVKSISQIDDREECPTCAGQEMTRQISLPPSINVSVCQWNAEYNPAFGKVIRNKNHLKDELARHKGETGKELVEIGTDTLKSIKKKHTPYTVDTSVEEAVVAAKKKA